MCLWNMFTFWFYSFTEMCLFTGDLLDEEKVFQWLTSQDVFEIKDEIEEVNRKMLEKLLDENDFVAVYFCEFIFMLI